METTKIQIISDLEQLKTDIEEMVKAYYQGKHDDWTMSGAIMSIYFNMGMIKDKIGKWSAEQIKLREIVK